MNKKDKNSQEVNLAVFTSCKVLSLRFKLSMVPSDWSRVFSMASECLNIC